MKLRSPALLLLLATSTAVLAAKPIDRVAGWSIYRNKADCSAYSVFADDESVGISYDASDRATSIVFTDADATSLDEGDTRTIDIYLKRTDGSLDDRWKGTEFTVGTDADKRRIFVSAKLDEPALNDFKNATAVTFFYNDKKIAAYQLAGSAAALKAVKQCSQRLHHINPNDVFAGEG
jgi:hypothetical protein